VTIRDLSFISAAPKKRGWGFPIRRPNKAPSKTPLLDKVLAASERKSRMTFGKVVAICLAIIATAISVWIFLIR